MNGQCEAALLNGHSIGSFCHQQTFAFSELNGRLWVDSVRLALLKKEGPEPVLNGTLFASQPIGSLLLRYATKFIFRNDRLVWKNGKTRGGDSGPGRDTRLAEIKTRAIVHAVDRNLHELVTSDQIADIRNINSV